MVQKYIQIILDSSQAKRNADELDKSVEGVGKSADKTTFSMNKLAKAIAGVIAVRQLTDYSSIWTDLVSRTNNAIDAQENAYDVMERIADVARRSYGPLEAVAEVFLQNATALTQLGYSTQQQLDLTESLSLALVIAGAKADRATVVINAFSRAMAVGKLAGDDYNVIVQNGGEVINAMARALKVSVLEMRDLARAGKIGRKEMALITNELEDLREKADGMAATVNDAFLILRNNAIQTVGTLGETTGAAELLSSSIILVADNLDLVVDAAAVLTGLMVARTIPTIVLYTKTKMAQIAADQLKLKTDLDAAKAELARVSASAKMVQANLLQAKSTEAIAASQMRLIAISNTLIAAKTNLTAATAAYTRGATLAGIAATGLGRALAFVGGPAGLLLLVASSLIYFTSTTEDATKAQDELTKSVENMTRAQAIGSKNRLMPELERLTKEMKIATTQISNQVAVLKLYEETGKGSEKVINNLRKAMDKSQETVDNLTPQIETLTNRIKDLDSAIQSGGGKREIIDPTNLKTMSAVDEVIAQIMYAQELANNGFQSGQDPFADSFDFEKNGAVESMRRGTASMQRELELRRELNQIYIEGYHSDLRSQFDNERALVQSQELERKAQLMAQAETERQDRMLAKQQMMADASLDFQEKTIVEQEFANQEKLAAQLLEEDLNRIRQDGVNQRKQIDEMERKARISSFGSMGSALMALGEGQSKKVFELGKVAALASASVSLPSAVLESFNNSGGYPWGIPAAVAMGAVGLKNIMDIKNAKFGGTPSTSVQAAAPSPSGGPQGGGGPSGNFTVAGYDARSLYTGEQLQNLGGALQDWWKNGGGDGNVIYQGAR